MSSDSNHHHNQQLLHNHFEYDFHNGFVQNRDHSHHTITNDCRHEEEMEGQGSVLPEAIIRGNMQYVNGELRKIPRPLNAFMIFSNEKRKELKREFPGEPNNMISSRLGAAWKDLEDECRKKYHDMAHREDLEHRRKYPNYQYCPGHARKLKKARREQRLRQQGLYRGSRQSTRGSPGVQGTITTRRRGEMAKQKEGSSSSARADPFTTPVKRENTADAFPTSSTLPRRSSANQVVHGISGNTVTSSMLPGPYGEGPYSGSTSGYVAVPEGPSECILSCCNRCKPTDIYCCPDSHWNTDALAAPHGFTPTPYPPPMFYFSPGYEASFPSDPMTMSHPCLIPGDCNGCYPSASYVDGCFGPVYPAAGDSSMGYKDLCFVNGEMPMTTSPNPATQVTSVGSMVNPMSDRDSELTDISNSMVPSCCHESHASSHLSCGGECKDSNSVSPGPFQEISPPSNVVCSPELSVVTDI